MIEQPLESHVESPFAERLVELGLWLVEHDPLWRERPFTGLPVAWEAEHEEVATALRSLSNKVIEVFETRPEDLPQMPAAYRQWAAAARRFSARPQLRRGPAFSDERLPQHVKGRKWQQVVAFVRTVLDHRPPSVSRWVDWCSGKGHLGRTLAEVSGLPLTCVERQRPLCRDGLKLLGPSVSEVRFVEADVLAGDRQAELDDLFGPGVGGVALHACGQLHRELLTRATARGAEFLALAPCCHHATPIDPFCPLSTVARKIPLRLGNHQLRLIGLHEAVAGPRRLILRRREQAWRLGLDLILREATGEDRYRPLGSVPRSWMRSSCQEFCLRLLSRAGLDLPPGVDLSRVEALGEERYRTVRALGMVRGLFRGALETWLLLDQAQFLHERGYQVTLGSFCPESVTPRNALLMAVQS